MRRAFKSPVPALPSPAHLREPMPAAMWSRPTCPPPAQPTNIRGHRRAGDLIPARALDSLAVPLTASTSRWRTGMTIRFVACVLVSLLGLSQPALPQPAPRQEAGIVLGPWEIMPAQGEPVAREEAGFVE